MNYTVKNERISNITKNTADINIGTMFLGSILFLLDDHNSNRGLFLKTYNSVVFMDDPSHTWDYDINIDDYMEVECEIIVK